MPGCHEVVFDVSEFREFYPQFADPVKYTDARLQGMFDTANAYLCALLKSPCDLPYCPDKGIVVRKIALYALMCHLLTMADRAQTGQSGPVTSATEGSVSVGFAGPMQYDTKNPWSFFGLTPCGEAFWTLISPYRIANMAGGMYVPCKPVERWG